MLLPSNNEKLKILKDKIFKNERLNSAISPKIYKDTVHLNYNHSYNISQPHYNITKSFEESKKVLHNNPLNSMLIFEKEKNILLKNLKKQIKIDNLKEKMKTEKRLIKNVFEFNNNDKNKINALIVGKNHKINKKRFSNNSKEVFQFIDEINQFNPPNNWIFENLKKLVNYRLINKESLKNTIFLQMFKKIDTPTKKSSDELLYKYILKNTFKEVLKKGYLNNVLISKQEIKDEYHKQINQVKRNFPFFNKEHEIPYCDKDLGSLLINNSSNLSNSKDNKVIINKCSKIISKIKHKRNRPIFQNNSVDHIYSKFYNSNRVSLERKNKNNRSNNQVLTKNNLMSFTNNTNNKINEFHKEGNKNYSNNKIFKTYSRQNKFNNFIIKPKNIIISNNIIQKLKLKADNPLNSENTKQETNKGFKIFLSKNNSKEKNNKNEDIINCINNTENIKFSKRVRERKINNYNSNNFFEKSDTYNNSLNFQNRQTEQIERILLKEKFNIGKNFFRDENKDSDDKMTESKKENNYQLFNNEKDRISKENKIKNNDKKILLKKIYVQQSPALKERKFKDLLKDEKYEINVKVTNNKIEDEGKNLLEKDWQNRFNIFKKYIKKLKQMSNDEFKKDTLKFINNY